ncbi:exodeoxyribonuclease V subunit alpha [Pseudoxanthomonas kaohsiungensis]|uniref:RecBCD enzyme subunit RecD n=1 Tax=Pseudoxanthomonas kaohsiungensis TaxID=283923 RepID=A0ABW3LWS6_9GAMM|nr:exodeoxyribonuclease V subunit alpha [Pseudoxanthomonas kaohsiungensis]KAF1704631.1 exodeoxyribonuclease V subunit alpha [Pseudoxanthomonas kaohsiungensis]
MSLFRDLQQAGVLRALDDALALALRRLDPQTPDLVLAGAALASLAVAQGHAGFDPARPRALVEASLPWPDADEWIAELQASRWVAAPDAALAGSAADAPLVFERFDDGGSLLYLRRYREYERQLAGRLRRIAAQPLPVGDRAALAPLLAALFPHANASADAGEDQQARAAETALHHPLLLVTGGPGTGKTTTITRLLVLLAAQAREAGRPAPRIALAAPTGRAAERMAGSVRGAVQQLAAAGIERALCEALPATGTTLHRLLGAIPDSPRFRHDADHPLPFDVVVVDEASMIDLPLMAKLADAVADGARLVLLGDPDQLPSVEAGDVLAGILHAADAATPAFPAAHVHLVRGYRQDASLRLAPLAAAVRDGDAPAALSLLRGGDLAGVHFHENALDPLQAQREPLLAHWRALAQATDPAQALAEAGRMRLLTAVRDGPQGARTLNARIEALLAGTGVAGARGRGPSGGHFHGRLLLVTENSYRHGLFNGDIGVCLSDPRGVPVAWFPGADPAHPRAFHPAALPAHESAFAMTVHKAQGSEFDTVWLLLPARPNRVLSRELVYTGLTRARRELHLAASASILEAALARHASRHSGLGWRLQQQD